MANSFKLLLAVLSFAFVVASSARAEVPRKLGVAIPYVYDKLSLEQKRDPVSAMVLANVAYGLTRVGADGEAELQTIKDINVSADAKTYTFTLQDEVAFPLEQVFSAKKLQEIFDWHLKNGTEGAEIVESVEVFKKKAAHYRPNKDIKIVFKLKEASAEFLAKLSGWPLLNVEVNDLFGAYLGKSSMFSALGPYYLRSSRKDKGVVLEAHPDFFRPGYPRSVVLDFRYYESAEQALSALRVGAVDMIALPTTGLIKNISDDPTLIELESPLKKIKASAKFEWEMPKLVWSNSSDENDRLRTDSIIVRKSLRLDDRFKEGFDLSGVFLP